MTKYQKQPSTLRFFVPATLESDFDNFLDTDIPGYVMDFVKMRDYYDEQSYQTIRGQIYPDTTKSRYADTDNNLNFRTKKSIDVIKGDMLQDDEGNIYLLDWQIAPQHNNKASRAVRCNARISLSRYEQEQTDEDGYLIQQAGFNAYAEDLPCNILRYEGRPQYSATSHSPGVVPNALTIVQMQYNDKTKQVQIDDQFNYEKSQYTIVDIDYVGVSLNGQSGVIRLQCRKKAGGLDE